MNLNKEVRMGHYFRFVTFFIFVALCIIGIRLEVILKNIEMLPLH